MAYLTKRLGRWQAAYRGPDHKERTRTFDRKVDAEKWLAANVTDIARGAWVDPVAGRVTFSEYAKGWKATKADVAERTRINIEGRLDNHVVPYFGDMPVASIRPTDVRKFVAKLTGAGLAPSTVKATYLTASQVFAQAVTDGIIARTPCIDIRLPRERQHEEMHFLSPVQVNDLASATAERYRALIYTAAYGGLRAGELMALRVESLELGGLGGTISVTSAASEVRGKLVFGPTKTGRPRVIRVPRFLSTMLAEHVERYPSANGLVFTAREGGPIRHRNLYRRHFRPAVASARKTALEADREHIIPEGLRFHDLRHTCAAILIANGRHMQEVKEHLGHSSIPVTSDRYGHLFPSARQAVADGLETVFQSVSSPAALRAVQRRPFRSRQCGVVGDRRFQPSRFR